MVSNWWEFNERERKRMQWTVCLQKMYISIWTFSEQWIKKWKENSVQRYHHHRLVEDNNKQNICKKLGWTEKNTHTRTHNCTSFQSSAERKKSSVNFVPPKERLTIIKHKLQFPVCAFFCRRFSARHTGDTSWRQQIDLLHL